MEDILLRDKNILEKIGLLAKSNDAVILLEGRQRAVAGEIDDLLRYGCLPSPL